MTSALHRLQREHQLAEDVSMQKYLNNKAEGECTREREEQTMEEEPIETIKRLSGHIMCGYH